MTNLDAMSMRELREFKRNCDTLASYAVLKRSAMKARLSGDIQRAVSLESKCTRLYNLLPESLRW